MTENYRITVYFTSSIASGGRRGHARALQSVCSKHQFDDQLTKADNLNWCLSLRSKFPVIARPVRTLVVAIPRIEGKCAEKYPEEWDSLQFLVGIVTWFLSTGGLPHQSADWFAMTDNFGRAATNTIFPLS